MTYGHLIAATVMTLGVCQCESVIASFSTLSSVVRSLCHSRASCRFSYYIRRFCFRNWTLKSIRNEWSLNKTRSSAIAEGLRDAHRIPATTKHFIWKLESRPTLWHYLRNPTFRRFDTIPECDRHTHIQTDGQTHDDGISIVSHSKNRHIARPN